mmetsp:Transcript_40403/g.65323  ORF Transcript_40403/g.65323 Transcript_40403/m.65323 type:complete len:200 (-) Transcript_40403:49-648(-)
MVLSALARRARRWPQRPSLSVGALLCARLLLTGPVLCFAAAKPSPPMSYKLAVVARSDLGLSAGKLAAQVGHAVHDAVTGASKKTLEAWEEDGSMIIVLQVDSEQALAQLEKAAQKKGVKSHDCRDEGLTEVEDDTWTALAVGPELSSKVDAVTGKLELYRDDSAQEELKALRARAEAAEAEVTRLRSQIQDLGGKTEM